MSGKHRSMNVTRNHCLKEIKGVIRELPHVTRSFACDGYPIHGWSELEVEAYDVLEDYFYLLGDKR